LDTRQDRRGTAPVPDLLTVEEAASVLRIGRTKAYAMAREWRATGGRSGLPVIDFGHALRVPRHALEELIGAPIATEGVGGDAPTTTVELEAPQAADESLLDESAATRSDRPAREVTAVSKPDPASTPSRASRRPSRRRTPTPDQPTLPFAS
jgi:hypothetical protein